MIGAIDIAPEFSTITRPGQLQPIDEPRGTAMRIKGLDETFVGGALLQTV